MTETSKCPPGVLLGRMVGFCRTATLGEEPLTEAWVRKAPKKLLIELPGGHVAVSRMSAKWTNDRDYGCRCQMLLETFVDNLQLSAPAACNRVFRLQ